MDDGYEGKADDIRNCLARLTLKANGWGITLQCTLNRYHTGVHIAPVRQSGYLLVQGTKVMEWETYNV